jgi:hypothetical protein
MITKSVIQNVLVGRSILACLLHLIDPYTTSVNFLRGTNVLSLLQLAFDKAVPLQSALPLKVDIS